MAHAVRAIGISKARRQVFEAIYSGHKKIKTFEDIKNSTGIKDEVIILQRANELFADQIIEREKKKIDGRWAYAKDPFYSRHRHQILGLIKSKEKLSKFLRRDQPQAQIFSANVKAPADMVKGETDHNRRYCFTFKSSCDKECYGNWADAGSRFQERLEKNHGRER